MDILEKLQKMVNDQYNQLNEDIDKKELKIKIFDYFKKNPAPPDDDIHDWADDLGIDHDLVEEVIYELLGSFIGYGNANKTGFELKDADKKELAMGRKVELEHTNCPMIAERIALDHLSEISDYYTRLAKMESDAGVED